MRCIFVVLLPMILGGCLPDREKELAVCRTEADHFFEANIADNPDNPKSQFIIGCMATKGYDFSVVPSDCDSRYPFPTQSDCYVPNSWLDWIVDKFRTAKEAKLSVDTSKFGFAGEHMEVDVFFPPVRTSMPLAATVTTKGNFVSLWQGSLT